MEKVWMRWPYPRTPLLGRNLPSTFSEGEKVFDKRVKERFPIGTSETSVVDELEGQGFSVDPAPFADEWRRATIRRGILIQTLWSVHWRAGANRIENIAGVYGVIAP